MPSAQRFSPFGRGRRTPEQEGRSRARSDALRLALIYAVAAGVWIALSDRVLAFSGLPRDVALLLSAIKGEGFVVVTAILLYLAAMRHLNRLYISEERHARLFEHSTEGLTVFRVERDRDDDVADLVIEDVNPTQARRLQLPRGDIVGQRMSAGPSGERLKAYFDVARSSVEANSPSRTELSLNDEDVDEIVATYPIERDLWTVAAMDVTEMRKAREALLRQDEWIRDAYVDVLDAVTGGKLLLVSESELASELGKRVGRVGKVRSAAEIGKARQKVREAVRSIDPDLAQSPDLQNPLGEALNNVVKHAGGGEYAVYVKDSGVQLLVSDVGPGIDFRTLPKATLVAGFSTASTLGMGFTIMLQLCDRVLISTHPGHTVVVLEVSTHPDGKPPAGLPVIALESASLN